jgi:hypothetical protein
MALDKSVDTEPSDRLAVPVDEYTLFRFAARSAKPELLDGDRL